MVGTAVECTSRRLCHVIERPDVQFTARVISSEVERDADWILEAQAGAVDGRPRSLREEGRVGGAESPTLVLHCPEHLPSLMGGSRSTGGRDSRANKRSTQIHAGFC